MVEDRRHGTGRIRLRQVADYSAASIHAFYRRLIHRPPAAYRLTNGRLVGRISGAGPAVTHDPHCSRQH